MQTFEPKVVDTLIYNISMATMSDEPRPDGEGKSAIGIFNGKIAWLGNVENAPAAKTRIDGLGQWLTPGLIDCHTHLVYGGNRASEFEMKLNGASYEAISNAGGGIVSTVSATRSMDEASLLAGSRQRLETLMAEGITTIEIKSGYGLDTKNEIKMLRVARSLEKIYPISIRTSFLGAHALPPEFDSKDDYIQYLIDEVLPAVHKEGLADAVDFFCEGIGFSRAQCEKICQAAKKYHLPIKGHVEQLSNLGGASLVAEYEGLSVDHIEYLDEADVPILKAANLVAVLLPGAFYSLSETKLPPIQALRENKLPIAIATDLNPGSSPIASLLTVMNLACVQFKLTPYEVLLGVTKNAAKALGMEDQIGQIKLGFDADLVLWPIETPAQLCYGMNLVKPTIVFKAGEKVNE
ncbi:MAG: imidazolonepropionase [Flavobacterium sp.]|jgi:imidazolonepropionase